MLDRADPRTATPWLHRSGISASVERVAAARMLAADHSASPKDDAAGVHPPAADRALLAELARLRKRAEQQEHSLAVMADAISALRSGCRALRAENRELRHELQAAQRLSATAGRSKLRARDQQHEPHAPEPTDRESRSRAEITRRELRASHRETRS